MNDSSTHGGKEGGREGGRERELGRGRGRDGARKVMAWNECIIGDPSDG